MCASLSIYVIHMLDVQQLPYCVLQNNFTQMNTTMESPERVQRPLTIIMSAYANMFNHTIQGLPCPSMFMHVAHCSSQFILVPFNVPTCPLYVFQSPLYYIHMSFNGPTCPLYVVQCSSILYPFAFPWSYTSPDTQFNVLHTISMCHLISLHVLYPLVVSYKLCLHVLQYPPMAFDVHFLSIALWLQCMDFFLRCLEGMMENPKSLDVLLGSNIFGIFLNGKTT